MAQGPDTPFGLFVSVVYPAWSLLWATLWIMVAVYYGGAAYQTWKINGATMRSVFCDIFDPLMFAFRDFVCRWKWGCKLFCVEAVNYKGDLIPTSSPGNILRFAIFIASMTPISFGLAFAFVDVWRGAPWKLVITMVFMFTSNLGALGHLFLAHRGNRRVWSNIVVYSTLWAIFGPLVFLAWRSM